MRVSLDQSISQYLTDYAREHKPRTVSNVRHSLDRFRVQSKVQWIDAVSWYHINQYAADNNRTHVSNLRNFLKWCNESYRRYLPVPPFNYVAPRAVAHHPASKDRARQWVANAKAAAERMVLPHQKAVFLCGYLYGLPIERVVRMSLADLCALPTRPDFYDLLSELRTMCPASGPAFAAWLGSHVQTARAKWREWSGRVPFSQIICAGDVARVNVGIRPVGGRRQRAALLEAMPAATEALLEKMPMLWMD
jgi:hypothetical protein